MITKKQLKNKVKQIPFVQKILFQRNKKRFQLNFKKEVYKNPPAYIFQMGKVGSSSAFHSIKNQYHGMCIRSHWFSDKESDLHVKALYNLYQKEKFPIKIISMVREPISRNISAFFQNFERDTGTKYKDHNFSLQQLQELFLKNYKHEMPLTWLDDTIKAIFGIDVYEMPFPESGYKTYQNGPIELLLYKHDVDDATKEKIISDYLQIPNFKLSNINMGAAKEYAVTYKEFINLKMPHSYLDAMLNSKYTKHFYTSDIYKIRQKWSS
ncbi:putative capsular polysaccharide synthesis family protein [Cochleicola gelatinilyticus]|uniref:Sulfotransferase domain-containing protein n=1 Tax=Cochleicola gelatinilyticus TaxID=1763537 RepID=A0A167K6G8_9FLAO|nr:putative capsular polysaccharide synthesis family protein [Cochleicola gelatinilyticus]OAB81438.1 hypothetical protein ULVI_01040 [Cochleicola gelatinilyticus]